MPRLYREAPLMGDLGGLRQRQRAGHVARHGNASPNASRCSSTSSARPPAPTPGWTPHVDRLQRRSSATPRPRVPGPQGRRGHRPWRCRARCWCATATRPSPTRSGHPAGRRLGRRVRHPADRYRLRHDHLPRHAEGGLTESAAAAGDVHAGARIRRRRPSWVTSTGGRPESRRSPRSDAPRPDPGGARRSGSPPTPGRAAAPRRVHRVRPTSIFQDDFSRTTRRAVIRLSAMAAPPTVPTMPLREEQAHDREPVRSIHRRAFGGEHGGTVADLVDALRRDDPHRCVLRVRGDGRGRGARDVQPVPARHPAATRRRHVTESARRRPGVAAPRHWFGACPPRLAGTR